ncbi:family 1 glycosylhydrolase [Opitutus terrae]|uniref:Glycoside hydrolase family 1 n=1 Tax=Opitutus terrae (strain DSM 11246 / JCM 15787 / PB90-1) TaxID=452637 RepID=B1ZWE4_OPITP|nr:family 1 glycosylhydrolase [Opitutus terrae]ACB76900.1 glycoside hydrolase family 1 [Opitutus terrae PB90-1]
MVDLRQSHFGKLVASGGFLWCTGIEDTFITAPSPKTGRTLDEYELTGHYEHWREDIDLMAELGVPAARYGIPWHRICPQPGVWDWQWADRPLERMLDRGIAPIVDLVHYGLPAWIEPAYLHPDYPNHVAEFAARVAARFKGRIFAYTPLNEPRITAWYCGRLGWWPPFRRSWRGFVAVMLGVCRGIIATLAALRSVDPEILPVHVDATDHYHAEDPSLVLEAEHRQAIVFLALDLISGRITDDHPLFGWLLSHGTTEGELAWFRDHAVPLPWLGLNLYPMFTRKVLQRTASGHTRISMIYSTEQLVEDVTRLYWERYHAPLLISETASSGSIRKRRLWLDGSARAVQRLRAEGVPLLGYTWWPLFALVTWGYRQGDLPPQSYFRQMGLWDLDPHQQRARTSLVDRYQELVRGGTGSAGPLSAAASRAPVRS